MKLWTLVHDSDSGTSTEVFTDPAKLNARACSIIAEDWDDAERGKMPDDWRAAWEQIDGAVDWWISVQEHEIETPGLTKLETVAMHFMAASIAGVVANPNDFIVSRSVMVESAILDARALIGALK